MRCFSIWTIFCECGWKGTASLIKSKNLGLQIPSVSPKAMQKNQCRLCTGGTYIPKKYIIGCIIQHFFFFNLCWTVAVASFSLNSYSRTVSATAMQRSQQFWYNIFHFLSMNTSSALVTVHLLSRKMFWRNMHSPYAHPIKPAIKIESIILQVFWFSLSRGAILNTYNT